MNDQIDWLLLCLIIFLAFFAGFECGKRLAWPAQPTAPRNLLFQGGRLLYYDGRMQKWQEFTNDMRHAFETLEREFKNTPPNKP